MTEVVYLNHDAFLVDAEELGKRLRLARESGDYIPVTEWIEHRGLRWPEKDLKVTK